MKLYFSSSILTIAPDIIKNVIYIANAYSERMFNIAFVI